MLFFSKCNAVLALGAVAAGLFFAPMAHAQSDAAATSGSAAATHPVPDGQRVFYASHSLMWEVPDPLGEAAKAYGIKDHTLVGLQRLGFSRTSQHWELPDAQNEAKKALKTGKVDVFVMSPMEMPDTGVENFVKYGLEYNPKTRFLVQVNWGGFDDDGQKAHQNVMKMGQVDWNARKPEDLKTFNLPSEKAFEAQADAINKEVGRKVVFLIPSSQAADTLRTMIYNNEVPALKKQSDLFRDGIGHPTEPLVALNMYCHFACIYKVSPVGLPMPSILKNPQHPEWDEALNKTLQEVAWKTVSTYPYSGVGGDEAKTE